MKTRAWEWDEANQCGYALCTECGGRAVPNKHAGFQASKLYSPVTTIVELAEKWIACKDDPESKQVFYNTQLALTYQLQAMRKVESHSLMSRREKFDAQVPDRALVMTAGIDVQSGGDVSEGRLEIEVVAWGEGFESWSVEYHVIHGDMATPTIWAELDKYLQKKFKDSQGRERGIEAVCIDTGGHSTEAVYRYCAPRHKSNIWGIKGKSDREGQWSPVWPAPAKYDPKKTRPGYRPIMIGVNAAKEAIRELLLVDTPGPGYQHFPEDRPNNYFEQLTSEKLLLELKGGRTVKFWKAIKGVANEALDVRVYAYAALRGLMVNRKFNFAKRATALEALGIGPATPSAVGRQVRASESPSALLAGNTGQNSRVRRSSFMG
jgi:phage terminase large subunit GpA-like protein